MGRLLFLLMLFTMVTKLSAHSVQIQYCVGCEGQFTVWVEHWHGYEDPSTTSMTMTISYDGVTEVITSAPGGEAHDLTAEELPGCSTPIAYVAGCPGQENNYLDWVFYEFVGIPEGAIVTFTIIEGLSAFTADGCGMYPLEWTFEIPYSTELDMPTEYFYCHNEVTEEIVLPGDEFGWLNDNPTIGLDIEGTGTIPSFTTFAPEGGLALLEIFRASCLVDTIIILVNPLPINMMTLPDTICKSEIVEFGNESYIVSGDFASEWIVIGELLDSVLLDFEPIYMFTDTGLYTIELVTTSDSGCVNTSLENLYVSQLPSANMFGFDPICEGTETTPIYFIGEGGQYPYTFEYRINGGAVQTVVSDGDTAQVNMYTFEDTSYVVELISVSEGSSFGCNVLLSDTLELLIRERPNGYMLGSTQLCQNSETITLQLYAEGGMAPYIFTVINTVGDTLEVLSDIMGEGVFDVLTDIPGTFIYELIGITESSPNACYTDLSDIDSVVVNELPVGAILGSAVLCQNEDSIAVIMTGEGGIAPYLFYYTVGGDTLTLESDGLVGEIMFPTDSPGVFEVELIGLFESSDSSCYNEVAEDIVITINSNPNATIGSSADLCQYDEAPTVIFEGEDGTGPYVFHYTLNGGDTLYATDADSAFVTLPTILPGTFEFILIGVEEASESNCFTAMSDTGVIRINEVPTGSIMSDTVLCQYNGDIPVGITGEGGMLPYTFNYTINDSDTLEITSVESFATIFIDTEIAGEFLVGLTGVMESSETNCFSFVDTSIVVLVNPVPAVFAGDDFETCFGDDALLNATGAGPGGTYEWTDDIINGISFISESTNTYIVLGTDTNGCYNSDTIHHSVLSPPVAAFTSDVVAICDEECVQFTSLSYALEGTSISDIRWLFNDISVVGDSVPYVCFDIESSIPVHYDVILLVEDGNGCVDSLIGEDYFVVIPNPIAAFEPHTFELNPLDPFVDVMNNSELATLYYWDFGDGYGFSEEYEPTYVYDFPSNTYLIQLIATSENGLCADTTHELITVPSGQLFYVPNAFTPDGDVFNESFQPVFTSGFDPYNYKLTIYNRWGEIVFVSYDANVGWNGTYGDNGLVNDEVYVWSIEFSDENTDKKFINQGHVTVLK